MPPFDNRRRVRWDRDGGPGGFAVELYWFLNSGLWALGVALIVWAVLHVGDLADARAAIELRRAEEAALASRSYCEKWGMPPGTRRYSACQQDLEDIRDKARKDQLADAGGFL